MTTATPLTRYLELTTALATVRKAAEQAEVSEQSAHTGRMAAAELRRMGLLSDAHYEAAVQQHKRSMATLTTLRTRLAQLAERRQHHWMHMTAAERRSARTTITGRD